MNNYEKIIRRRLAYLIQATDTSIINSPAKPKVYQRFNEQKEKEIVVWIRQLKNMDKQQIKNNIIDKFHISEEEAERLFFIAYPDGLSLEEQTELNKLERSLPIKNQTEFIDDSITVVLNDQSETSDLPEKYGIHPEIANLFIQFLILTLGNRNIIQLP